MQGVQFVKLALGQLLVSEELRARGQELLDFSPVLDVRDRTVLKPS